MSFFSELKRRNVIRVALAYGVLGWLLTEISSVVMPTFGAPGWVMKVLIFAVLLGLAPTLVFSWVYELTPQGLKKESDIDRDHSITAGTGHKLNLAIMAMLVLVAALLGYREFGVRGLASPPPDESMVLAPVDKSIAVLPFVNMSSDPEQEYFSDGITEELLNVLVKIDGLRVPSRTSSFAFKGKQQSIGEIAAALGVDHVLEGSVRKSGEQIRVTAQLIDVRSDKHLWSETYTRTLDDVFAIQDEIASAIVAALKVALGEDSPVGQHVTNNTDAYNHYLRGRFFWHQRTQAGFVSSERELRQAVALDAGFARAWAALADVYLLQPEYGWAEIGEAIPKAREAAERALLLDPKSARAHTTRAYYHYLYDWDWVGAEREFLRAIELDPGYATAHQWYAEMLGVLRRFDEALDQAELAARLDPLAPIHPIIIARIHAWSGRTEEERTWLRKAAELAPNWPLPHFNLMRSYLTQGRFQAARDELARWEQARSSLGESPHIKATIDALAGLRPRDEAIAAVLSAPNPRCGTPFQPVWLMLLGADEEALKILHDCREQGDPFASYINAAPVFQRLRGRQDFDELLAELHLPED